jgi:hypothetical protein
VTGRCPRLWPSGSCWVFSRAREPPNSSLLSPLISAVISLLVATAF